jgi:hypothetical protein
MIEAADAAAESRNKIRDEYDKAFEELNGTKSGVQMEETIGGAWKEVKEAAEDFFATLGENTGIVQTFISLFKGLSDEIRAITAVFKTAEQEAREKQVESLKKQTEQLKEAAKVKEEQRKKDEEAAKERERQMEATKRHADSITQSLRRPDEVFRDTVGELKDLAAQGFLGSDTLERGIAKAKEDYLNAIKKPQQIVAENGPISAAERGHGAFSAIQAAAREQDKRLQLQQEQLAVEREQQAELQKLNRQIADRPITSIQVARLN